MTKIEFDAKIILISTNEMYMPGITKYRKPYMMKTGNLRKFEDEIDGILEKEITDEEITQLKSDLVDPSVAIAISVDTGMDETDYFRCDTSNYIKALEDAIKYRLKVDDTRNVRLTLNKHLIDENEWVSHIIIETYKLPYEVPDKWLTDIK